MLQLVIQGLAIGCIYALVALGLLLIYQAVGALNFAQGDFLMLGAFFGVTLAVILQPPLPLWAAYLATIAAMCLFGAIFQRLAYYPLRNRPFMMITVSTVGVGIALRNTALNIWGPLPLSMPSPVAGDTLELGAAQIVPHYVFIVVVTAVLVGLQYLFFTRTRLGRQMQATAQDLDMARLVGIRTGRMILLTFVLSSALAGVGGLLLGPIFFVQTDLGSSLLLKAFVASVVGGFGSIPGAIVAALFLGIVEVFAATFLSSAYKDVFAFVILLAVLLVIPHGLFGEKVMEKA